MTHEEAIDIVRKNYPHVGVSGSQFETALRNLIPELRESEDERIRKEIINYLDFAESHNLLRAADYEKKKGWLAYLEKQKELDKMIVVSPEVWDNAISYAFENGKKEGEKQKEQKPSFGIYWHKIKKGENLPCRAYLWNIDYEKHYDCFEGRLIANLENISVGRDTWYLPVDDVRNLPREGVDELPREQKPAEKQDYSGLTDLERAIHRGFLSAGVENVPVTIIKETANECKRTQTIANENANAEWSEEDEKTINEFCDIIASNAKNGYLGRYYAPDLIEKLKSLRPQPHWKPSEEQMRAMKLFVEKHRYTANQLFGGWPSFDAFESLYNDLKKLM